MSYEQEAYTMAQKRSAQNRYKILRGIRRNYIARSLNHLKFQFERNIKFIKNFWAHTNNTTTTSTEGNQQLPNATNEKVWHWLLNHHQEDYNADEEDECDAMSVTDS